MKNDGEEKNTQGGKKRKKTENKGEKMKCVEDRKKRSSPWASV